MRLLKINTILPAKVDNKRVGKKNDRRVKLTDTQREEIKKLYGSISQRRLAEQFSVSRRTIQFIGDPKKLEENRQRRAERGGWKQYYDKDSNKLTAREHRAYKKELLKLGKI